MLKGISTVLTGPGLVVIGGLIGKLFIDVSTFAAKSIRGKSKKMEENAWRRHETSWCNCSSWHLRSRK